MGTVMGFLTILAGILSISSPWIAGAFAATLIAILLVGIRLLFAGMSMVMLGAVGRAVSREIA